LFLKDLKQIINFFPGTAEQPISGISAPDFFQNMDPDPFFRTNRFLANLPGVFGGMTGEMRTIF